jgi:ADP-ribosyl-[dinitrogen reductase] hydrolase
MSVLNLKLRLLALVANPADQLLLKTSKIGGLWVGSAAAMEGSFLKDNNIDTVISLCNISEPDVKEHFYFEIKDSPSDVPKMKKLLPSIIRQIHKSRLQGHTVLVHCKMGIQRAPTVCTKYLEKYYYPINQAHKKLTGSRAVAFCNGHTFRELIFP